MKELNRSTASWITFHRTEYLPREIKLEIKVRVPILDTFNQMDQNKTKSFSRKTYAIHDICSNWATISS